MEEGFGMPGSSDTSWWGTHGSGVVAGGVGLLGSLFAPSSPDISGTVKKINTSADELSATGKSVAGEGAGALTGPLKYYEKISSGDPAAALEATMPERTRILDQYDTAKRALTMMPRSGGMATAGATLEASKAKDLSDLTSGARSAAMKNLTEIGMGLTQTGLGAQEAATQALASTLGPILQQEKLDQSSIEKTFSGLASFVGALMFA